MNRTNLLAILCLIGGATGGCATEDQMPMYLGGGAGMPGPGQPGPTPGPSDMGPGTGPTDMGPGTGPTDMGPGTGPTDMGPSTGPTDMGPSTGPTDMGPSTGPTDMGPGTGPTDMGPGTGPTDMGPVVDETPDGPCDLEGRWIATVHYVTEAIAQKQTGLAYVYYEIGKTDDGYEVKRGLHCGDYAEGWPPFVVYVKLEGAWEAARKNVSYVGRKATSTESAGGCDVHFEKRYVVRGASQAFVDPSLPLPDANTPATDMTPGWEDWDDDGQPGLTCYLTESAVGRVFTAPRQWNEMTGTVPDVMTSFVLPLSWDQEQNVMAWDPMDNILLGAQSIKSADPKLHFVEFARLAPGQAVGDDAATCEAVVGLVDTLTPKAVGITNTN